MKTASFVVLTLSLLAVGSLAEDTPGLSTEEKKILTLVLPETFKDRGYTVVEPVTRFGIPVKQDENLVTQDCCTDIA